MQKLVKLIMSFIQLFNISNILYGIVNGYIQLSYQRKNLYFNRVLHFLALLTMQQ
jgi:hypothetical protein